MTTTTTDTNGLIAALLRDLAEVQSATQSARGYSRAAAAVFGLDVPIETLLQRDGTIAKIPNVGPKSERVILEVLRTGRSPTVDAAVEQSPKAARVSMQRGLRSNFLSRAQVVTILDDESLSGPTVAQYRGDLQMHSTWSDGGQSLDDIAATAVERGYEFCGITDHSYGLPAAGGMSMARVAEQHRDIDRVNAAYHGRLRLFKGVEANIMADGSLDLSPDERSRFEYVLAAPHSGLRLPEDQTARMLAAVQTSGVHILGHPRGRMYGRRTGVLADWDAVFAAAARSNVAVEIDGDPARQDVDHQLAQRALEAGCLIALDSDAHATVELRYVENAIAHARLAGVPVDRVINCWPLDRLASWFTDRQSA
jgi:histidinol phosphatase-like PHP family hydrolase